MRNSIKDECGVFGVFGHPEASNLAYLGLYALQHRGQEGAGIVSSDGATIFSHKDLGLVAEVFDEGTLERLPGKSAIGHVRYPTGGIRSLKDVQPFVFDYAHGGIAICNNGSLTNTKVLREQLIKEGAIFHSTADAELMAHLFAHAASGTTVDRIINALKKVEGAYSALFLTERELVVARDPRGFRPLALGRIKQGYVVGSESCSFDLIEGEFVREIEPGEVLVINEDGVHSLFPFPKEDHKFCVFEFVYLARPDSFIFGHNVYEVRKRLGSQLAIESPVDADIVIPTPDSGFSATIGYAHQSGFPLELGIIRNHYVGRTFIEPQDAIRHFGVKIKLNPVKATLKGKKVIVVDDSIVRGTTIKKNMQMVRNAGAKEIHVRISSPPVIGPCYYGIDTPTREELIGSSNTIEEIRNFIGVNSLGYISIEGLRKAVAPREDEFCYACFSGDYPLLPSEEERRKQLNLFIKEV